MEEHGGVTYAQCTLKSAPFMNCHDWSTAADTQELNDFQPPCPCLAHFVPRRRGQGHPGTLHRQFPQNVFTPPFHPLGRVWARSVPVMSWATGCILGGAIPCTLALNLLGGPRDLTGCLSLPPRAVGAGVAPPVPAKWAVRFGPFLEALAGPLARARWTICVPPALDCWARFGRRPGIWLL